MQIFGHDLIKNSEFYHIEKIEEIKNTPPNSIILTNFNKTIISYCKKQELTFAVNVSSVKEIVLSAALNASYLIVDKKLALIAQKIANEYMYDAKILLITKDEDDIDFCAINGIDGIIFTFSVHKI